MIVLWLWGPFFFNLAACRQSIDQKCVLCYKVTRTKSRWKCILKDGIMHINNKDILFNKVGIIHYFLPCFLRWCISLFQATSIFPAGNWRVRFLILSASQHRCKGREMSLWVLLQNFLDDYTFLAFLM